MLMEGTGIYWCLLILVFFAVYITVKVCLGSLLKRAKEQAWKGYVPFYSGYVLVELLGLKKQVFYMSLIPFVNLYYFNIIIAKLLEGFGMDPKDSIWYVLIPMYKFPELVFKRPKFRLNEYDLTNEFIETQNVLFNKSVEELPEEIQLVDVNKAIEEKQAETIIQPSNFEQPMSNNMNNIMPNNSADNVYTNEISEDEKKKVTYVEAVQEEKKEEKPIIQPLDNGKPKVCPNCGATLAPTATACFMCGQQLY